jgi:hypothetical protein
MADSFGLFIIAHMGHGTSPTRHRRSYQHSHRTAT